MKAKPVRVVYGQGYVQCAIEEATHVTLNIPGPTGELTLPVIQRGTRDGTGCWTWNGSTDAPTLRPSVLTEGCSKVSNGPFRCHSWINDGAAQFLGDCSHDLANQTIPLLEVPTLLERAARAECVTCGGTREVDELIGEWPDSLHQSKPCPDCTAGVGGKHGA